MNSLYKINSFLSSAKLLHFALPILMLYLILGTFAQKYIGLYEASKIYFSAPVIWAYDIIPLPGMPVIVALIFVNLLFKIIFKSPWHPSRAGIILTHIGAMLLMLGGLFTALFSTEGYIALGKGEQSNIVSDYHNREFAITDAAGKALAIFDHKDLSAGQIITHENLPFSVQIKEYCINCQITARAEKTENHQGMAEHMQLSPAPLENNDEENMAGLTYQIQSDDQMPVFVSLEGVPQYPRISVNDEQYRFALRRQQRALPFSIELIEFEKEVYPGTTMAKSYRSTVRIKDGDLQWESVISMNDPLRYKGYTFFQSSFAETPKGYVSVLAAVWNVGRAFPYIAGILMCLGLILHLFLRTPKSRNKALPLIFAVAVMTFGGQSQTQAKDAPEMNTQIFGQIPILDEGRIKPIDSFARTLKEDLSGHENNALPWLIETLFDPVRAQERVVIKVESPEIRALLDLEKRKNKSYSYTELSKAMAPKQELLQSIMQAPEEDWTPQQRALVKIQDKLFTLLDLTSSLTAFLPLSVILPKSVPEAFQPYAMQPLTYMDMIEIQDQLQDEIQKIIAIKGENIEQYTPEEQALVHLSFTINMLRDNAFSSHSLNIIPQEQNRVTPWELIYKGKAFKASDTLQALANAYHASDTASWNENAATLYKELISDDVRANALVAEYYYNHYNPFYYSFILCVMALGAMILSTLIKRGHSLVRFGAFPLLFASMVIQLAGIGARIYILDRPPVSTLYETVLFVACLTTIYGLVAYMRQNKIMWLWLCVILVPFLHVLGFSHDQDGDSFVVLIAVLNTNFWLTTHVLCITAGYAFCAIVSALAHYALILQARGDRITPDRPLFKNIHTTALIALFFSGIGTVLGGIWADQSWGRFWGWDPKENGALLIVLWLIWALHGRISGQMKMTAFLSTLSYLSVILALSWFGVNLLGVGLHAYGFTDSLAYSLGAFIAFETLFVAIVYILIKRKARQNA